MLIAVLGWAVITFAWAGSLWMAAHSEPADACPARHRTGVAVVSTWSWAPPGVECGYVLDPEGGFDGSRGIIVEPTWTGPGLVAAGWLVILGTVVVHRRSPED